jgi:prepilin-type N-terminal cleavage/methylation domain-containing protein
MDGLMTNVLTAARQRLTATTNNDDGFTMLELIVVLVIMSIVMVIFTTGVTQAFSAEEKVDSAARSGNQLVIAFQRLDKEVRYAAAISTPATVNNPTTSKSDPVVEWLTSFTGTSMCTEVRLNAGTSQLQQRTWTSGASVFTPTPWQTLAEGITATTPFVTIAPNTPDAGGAKFQYQRLEIAITSTTGTNQNKSAKFSDVTFTALNTTAATTAATAGGTCNEGRGLSW